MTDNIQALLNDAADEGNLGQESLTILQGPNLNAQLQKAMGVDVDDIDAAAVTLVNLLVDDSSSIACAQNTASIIDGQNSVIGALEASVEASSILMHTVLLNGGTMHGFQPLSAADRLSAANYNPRGCTPLFERSIEALGASVAKLQQFSENGVDVRSITAIITDGGDNSGRSADDVKILVDDLLRQEVHMVVGIGVSDGSTDFQEVFRSMGIPDDWILTVGDSANEIRKAFAVVSQSAVQVSQTSAPLSQVALGGFGG